MEPIRIITHSLPNVTTLQGFTSSTLGINLVYASTDASRFNRTTVESEVLKTMAAIVRIKNERNNKQGLGSGAIITEDGYVLTAAHVVRESNKLLIKIPTDHSLEIDSDFNTHTIEMFTCFEGTVVANDETSDVAVVKIKNPPQGLKPILISENDLGEQVCSIGYIVRVINKDSERGVLLFSTGERLLPEHDIEDVKRRASNIFFEMIKRILRGSPVEGSTRFDVLKAYFGLASATNYTLSKTSGLASSTCRTEPGMSGGPTINHERRVIGVNSSANWVSNKIRQLIIEQLSMLGIRKPKNNFETLSHFASLEEIYRVIEQAGINLKKVVG